VNHGEQFDLDLAPTIAAIAAIAAIANPSYSTKLPALGLAADAALWSLELKDGTPGPGCSGCRASDPLPACQEDGRAQIGNVKTGRSLGSGGIWVSWVWPQHLPQLFLGVHFFLGWKIVL